MISLCEPSWVFANDSFQMRFRQANQYFQEKKYDSALQLYESCMEGQMDVPDLYYNAGCAAFESRHIGKAVYYFKKALLLAEWRGLPTGDILHNLHLAEQQVKNRPESLPSLFFVDLWLQFVHSLSLNAWAWLLLASIWLLSLIFILRQSQKGQQKLWEYAFRAAVVWLILLVGITFSAYRSTHPRGEAVCIVPETNLYAAPDSQSQVLMPLSGGVSCVVIDTAGSWSKIQLSNQVTGWVPSSTIRQL